MNASPGATGEVVVPVPSGTPVGASLALEVTNKHGDLVNVAVVQLGVCPARPLPQPEAGPPKCREEGDGFGLVLNRKTGEIESVDPRHTAALREFPSLHLTRFDFGDLGGPNAAPYEVLPKPATRTVEGVEVKPTARALQIVIRDRYEGFAGSVTWTLDRRGVGQVAYDCTYSGADLSAREIGARFVLPAECDELSWDRWSKWGVCPEDSISRQRPSEGPPRRDGRLTAGRHAPHLVLEPRRNGVGHQRLPVCEAERLPSRPALAAWRWGAPSRECGRTRSRVSRQAGRALPRARGVPTGTCGGARRRPAARGVCGGAGEGLRSSGSDRGALARGSAAPGACSADSSGAAPKDLDLGGRMDIRCMPCLRPSPSLTVSCS